MKGEKKKAAAATYEDHLNRGGVPQTEEHITHARSLYAKALRDEAVGQ